MNRKVLYGYQIEDGKLALQTQEAEVVRRIFMLCLSGSVQREIADTLNGDGILYSPERPVWTSFRISFILRNRRYTGGDSYPVLIDAESFQAVQSLLRKKHGDQRRQDRPVYALRDKLRCPCGGCLKRWFSSTHRQDTLYLECDICGARPAIPDAELLAEVERQAAEYSPPAAGSAPYAPSGEVVRLANAINRGLERPEQPEEVISLILRGISARYACTPAPRDPADVQRLVRKKDFDRAVKYITISADNAVTVTFR